MVLADLDRFIAAGAPLVKFVDRTYNLDEDYFLPMMKHLAAAKTISKPLSLFSTIVSQIMLF